MSQVTHKSTYINLKKKRKFLSARSKSEKSSNYDEVQTGCLTLSFPPALLISLSLTLPSITKCSFDNYMPKCLKTPPLGVRHYSLNDMPTHLKDFLIR